jgi:hypothetical protein
MRTVLTLVAAVSISLATLTALEWSANRKLPAGEVTIQQIEETTQVAQAEVEGQVTRTASRL